MIFLTCATTWIPHSWTLFILTAANVDHHRCAPVFCCINVGSIDGVNSMIFPPPPFFPVVCVFYSLCIALWCIYVIVILCKYTGSLSNDRQDDKTEGQRSVQEEKRVGPTAAEETDSNYHSLVFKHGACHHDHVHDQNVTVLYFVLLTVFGARVPIVYLCNWRWISITASETCAPVRNDPKSEVNETNSN